MLAAEIIPVVIPDVSAALPVDRDRMREITGRSYHQNPDDDFDKVILSSIQEIENETELKLLEGTFRAEFPVFTLEKYESLLIPGVNTTIVSVIDSVTNESITVGEAYARSSGNFVVKPPVMGWSKTNNESVIKVEFTAGGSIPYPIQFAIGSRAKYQFNEDIEDFEASRHKIFNYAYRPNW